ncbi:linear amide C-N hydrolase [Mycobacterium sp. Y57]|uniref:linear amide C-N hydrolase n=1 Tax=Mycolicibacterium xanthum TaxID=2796469 RepID=UPI001C85FB68|nr:linear amide C-N hydrolase [Mycolicibacterium xanthum]MBX7435217.1 linear amide C-N hydrolase [Mycolicibacterium xanthum]
MCTRVLYETGTGTYMTGRNADWNDLTAKVSLWLFPRGMKRDGGVSKDSVRWTSVYGSVITGFYDTVSADGMNEAGLVCNLLYQAEADYGEPGQTGRPTISIGAWLQYVLDSYASVAEAVAAMRPDPFTVVSGNFGNGRPASVHFSLSDSTGDSAIVEFLDGTLVIHHGRDYTVMTNSPVYDQQLAINVYWDLIGGNNMLPGTISAADRYVRASYNLKTSPKFTDRRQALAAVFSQMRAVSPPLGMTDPDKPNISSTLYRIVADHDSKRYYFDNVLDPSVFFVDLAKVDLNEGATPSKLDVLGPVNLAGDVSTNFTPTVPFAFLAP